MKPGAFTTLLSLWLLVCTRVVATQPEETVVDGATTTRRTVAENTALAIEFVQRQMDLSPIPGIALSVVYKNETVIARGFGSQEHGNPSAAVTADTMFQIGSFSKTFIAMGIGKLVDEGKMQWSDTVKTHLPWFQLHDKYAEKFTTLADLLAMNSVFGAYEGDIAFMLGVFKSEREMVQRLPDLATSRRLRPGYAYANMNYAILGQVIEHKTNQTWEAYLNATFWQPLGMTSTFGQPASVPQDRRNHLSHGHLICSQEVAGPFSLVDDSRVYMSYNNSYIAAGSIVSSIADLSKFSAFILRKGQGIFESSKVVADMITGRNISPALGIPDIPFNGYDGTSKSGNVWGAGFGFDLVGYAMYGHAYFDKGGDTNTFKTRNGWVPGHDLGVVLLANAERKGGALPAATLLDLTRSYILGLFLDEPLDRLNKKYQDKLDKMNGMASLASTCDPFVFQGATQPRIVGAAQQPTSYAEVNDIVGTYAAPFYGRVSVAWHQNQLSMQYGQNSGRLYFTHDRGVFAWGTKSLLIDGPVLLSTKGNRSVMQLLLWSKKVVRYTFSLVAFF